MVLLIVPQQPCTWLRKFPALTNFAFIFSCKEEKLKPVMEYLKLIPKLKEIQAKLTLRRKVSRLSFVELLREK